MTETTITLTAAERDLIGRALSDRMSICLATREAAERDAATRMLMRLQGLNIKPDYVRDAAPAMLAALHLAKPVCADAYYDALAVQENPTGDAVDYPAENAQATAAALAAWEAVNAAIALAEGREPGPLDVPEADTPDAADAEDENPFHPESPEGRAWERGEGREG